MEATRLPIMITLFVTIFLGFIGYSLPYPILSPLFLLPTHSILPIGTSLHTRTLLFGVVMALYPIGQFLGSPYMGVAADRYGRKRILILSLAMSACSYLLTGYAIFRQELWLLMLGRFLCGLGESAVAIAQSIASDTNNHEQLIKRFALLNVATNLGWILGPLLGGRLAENTGVHWFTYATPFYFAAGFVLFNILLVRFCLPTTSVKQTVSETTIFTFKNLVTVFWRNISKSHLRFYYCYGLLGFIAIFFFFNFYGVYLVQNFHYGPSQIGHCAAYIAIILAITNYVLPRVIKRFSLLKTSYISQFVFAITLILFILPHQSVWLCITLPFVAIFLASVETVSNILISQAATAEEQGAVMGTYRSLMVLGETITALIGGYLAGVAAGLPFIAGAIMAIIAGCFLLINQLRIS